MAERFASDLTFILLVLFIAALLGFLAGYFLRKTMRCRKCIELEKENESHKHAISKLEEQIVTQKFRIEKLLAEGITFDAARAKAAMGQSVKLNDLEIIEGIGPKISGILVNKGILTWKALSETHPEVISRYLIEEGGEKYRVHTPDTWPAQAKLAYEGEWEELRQLQDKLTGGRSPEAEQ